MLLVITTEMRKPLSNAIAVPAIIARVFPLWMRP